jgi:hypothetical protein
LYIKVILDDNVEWGMALGTLWCLTVCNVLESISTIRPYYCLCIVDFFEIYLENKMKILLWVLHCICQPIVECWWSVQKVSHPCVTHLHVNKKYFFNRTPVEEYYACVVRVSLSNGRVFDTPTLEDREMLCFIGCW